eukprot:SAG11_NODE_17182_length_525_cov_17.701878_1_plen_37_part_01
MYYYLWSPQNSDISPQNDAVQCGGRIHGHGGFAALRG